MIEERASHVAEAGHAHPGTSIDLTSHLNTHSRFKCMFWWWTCHSGPPSTAKSCAAAADAVYPPRFLRATARRWDVVVIWLWLGHMNYMGGIGVAMVNTTLPPADPTRDFPPSLS